MVNIIKLNQNYDDDLNNCDTLIKQAKSKFALKTLRHLLDESHKLSSLQKIKLGNLLRRSGQHQSCLKILYKFITTNHKNEISALAKIEFSGGLIQMGLTTEAREHLNSLDPFEKYPQALLQLGLSYFQEWDHTKAIPYLEKLMSLKDKLNHYDQLVAKSNLFVAYSFAQPSRLNLENLTELSQALKAENAFLLNGLVTQLIGRYWMNQKEFQKAQETFKESLQLVQFVTTFDYLIISKWNLVCETMLALNPKDKLNEWLKLRDLAQQKAHSETLRECDYYCGVLLENKETLFFCFHGTPFKAYRARLDKIQELKQSVPISLQFSKKSNFISNSKNALINLNEFIFPTDQMIPILIKKTFFALMSDFYRPMTVARLHQFIYEGQHWNPYSSPTQVRQLLFRLRKYLDKIKCGLKLVEVKNNYYLSSKKKSQIFIWDSKWINFSQENYFQLKQFFGEESFNFFKFSSYQKGSLRLQRSRLKLLIKNGFIEKIGNSKPAIYKLTDK